MDPSEEYQRFLREDARRLADEARNLRSALDDLSRGAARRRRRGVFMLALTIVIAFHLSDTHTEQCVVDGPRTDRAEFLCDLSVPLHDHSRDRHFVSGDDTDGTNGTRPEAEYPVEGRLVGAVLWTGLVAFGVRWAFRQHDVERDPL